MHKKNSAITFRTTEKEKQKIHTLATIEGKTVTRLVIDLVDREMENRRISAAELRKLPRDLRIRLLRQMTEKAAPFYEKYKHDLDVEEIGDGIE